jgi:hypothetical protein
MFLLLLFAILGVAVIVAFAIWFGAVRQREQRERMRILEDALRDDQLDEVTRQELLRGLVRDRDSREHGHPRRRGGLGRFAFGVGWLVMIAGLGLLATDDRDAIEVGAFFVVAGFGMVTLPMALREYDRRGQPAGNDT